MTPHKASNGRGTLLLDRVIAGVGRIRTATGTMDPKVRNQVNRMISRLQETGRLDLLRAMHSGQMKPLELLAIYQRDDLKKLPTGAGLQTIRDPWTAWVAATTNPKSATARRLALPVLIPFMPKVALYAHLPAALQGYRTLMSAERKPAAFNRVKAHVCAFLRDHLGRIDPLYEQAAAVEPMKELKTKRQAPSIRRAIAARDALPLRFRGIWWDMVRTGMRVKEFWATWTVDGNGVAIQGTKSAAAERIVPLVGTLATPRMHRRTYEDGVRAASLGVQPYDTRRAFEHLCEAAGIPPTRVKQYMGHSLKGDVTAGYGGVNVREFLVSDGAKMAAVIAGEEAAIRAEQKAVLRVS